jgi:hypothetical protein
MKTNEKGRYILLNPFKHNLVSGPQPWSRTAGSSFNFYWRKGIVLLVFVAASCSPRLGSGAAGVPPAVGLFPISPALVPESPIERAIRKTQILYMRERRFKKAGEPPPCGAGSARRYRTGWIAVISACEHAPLRNLTNCTLLKGWATRQAANLTAFPRPPRVYLGCGPG